MEFWGKCVSAREILLLSSPIEIQVVAYVRMPSVLL